MVNLTGNLGSRHRQFNEKVQDAVRDKVNFDEIKASPENSDVDVLFKIELASKYQNIDYIVEILKSGDTLFISKALKCLWMYNNEYSHIINTDFLHINIFPFMSIKMKHKMLSAIATNIREDDRIVAFHEYCQNTDLSTYALKFLLHTSEMFKLHFLQKQTKHFMLDNESHIKQFIKYSFVLVDAYCKNIYESRCLDTLIQVSYLCTVDAVKYMDLLEKYVKFNDNSNMSRLGSTVSKSIMSKNKARVEINPILYLNILNEKVIARYTTSENAKKFTTVLLTRWDKNLWEYGYKKYRYLFNLIPISERLNHLKAIYKLIYPDVDFEMSRQFYNLECYDMMTESEKEKWALRSLAVNSELFGSEKSYLWYKFVNFKLAFKEIKKLIYYTSGKHVRACMIETLVETAKTRDDIEALLTYFYDRHVNEDAYYKDIFLVKICNRNNVFDFDDACWTAFFKLWNSLKGYSTETYKAMSVIYYILHNKELTKVLQDYIDTNMNVYVMKQELDNLNKEKQEIVYKHLLMYFMTNLQNLVNITYNDETKIEIRKIIRSILDLCIIFEKKKTELPDLVKKYAEMDDELRSHFKIVEKITEKKIIEVLKRDPTSFIALLSSLKETLEEHWHERYSNVIRILRIYFHNDITQELISFLNQSLTTTSVSRVNYGFITHAVFMIFQLGSTNYLENFMMKYAPSKPKIEHDIMIDTNLNLQEAICRFACYARPPMSLESIFLYMKGDYIRYCLPAINKLYANLPNKICLQLVERMVNAPVSLQKHGLRLAFNCFSLDNLRKVALHTWANTKNVSLREVLYTSLFDKVIDVRDCDKNILFKILITFTEDLQETDTDNLFARNMRLDQLPDNLKGVLITASWKSSSKFSKKDISLDRQIQILRCFKDNIELIEEDNLHSFVYDHLHNVLSEKQISIKQSNSLDRLLETKWQIIAKYLITYEKEEEIEKRKSVLQFILQKIFEMWDRVQEDVFLFKKVFYNFVSYLESECQTTNIYVKSIPTFEELLRIAEENMSKNEIYLLGWRLKLRISAKNYLCDMQDNEPKIEIIAGNFALQMGRIVREYVDDNIFHLYLVKEISEIYDNNLTQFCNLLRFDYEVFSIYVANNLIKHDLKEIYLLVVNTLPLDGKECETGLYGECINKIKQFNDEGVQCYINCKLYGRGDFKRRKYF